MTVFDKKMEWLKKYIDKNGNCFDVLVEKFVDSYEKEFRCKVAIQMYGANKCRSLQTFLSEAYKRGYLKRGTIGIKNGYGFPNWVYGYSLREEYQF